MPYWIVSKVRTMASNRTANVAIITALCAFPLFGMMGVAIDYALAISTKAKLDTAADAAVIAAITKAKTVIGGGGSQSSAIALGQAQGLAAFRANMGALSFVQTTPVPTVNIVSNGQLLTATVSYASTSQNQFGKLFNVLSTNMSGSVVSSSVVTPYYQFIFVVDISGSMSIGGTLTDINGLYNDNAIMAAGDGHTRCSFACHDPGHFRTNGDPRSVAKNKWTLKIDYVNQAIQNFISSLKTKTAAMPGVFSVGIDTFATSFNVLQSPTANLTTAQNSASLIDIEPMQPLSVSQGYTRTTSSLQSSLSLLNNIGDGTSPSKQATYVIFLSDGVEDIEGNVIYGRGTDISYTSVCTAIKNSGATLISIAAPYPIISLVQDPDGQYQKLVQPFQPPTMPNMTTAMTSCASNSTWAFQATDGPGIQTAVNTVLQQILQGMTRLTQ